MARHRRGRWPNDEDTHEAACSNGRVVIVVTSQSHKTHSLVSSGLVSSTYAQSLGSQLTQHSQSVISANVTRDAV